MTKEQAEKIEEAGEELGFEVEARLYSGRFMYGEETWSVVGDLDDVTEAVFEAGFKMREFRRDSLGLRVVIY